MGARGAVVTDAAILANRAASDRALNRPELRAVRLAIHEAYNDMLDAERHAGAAARHYAGMVDPRGLGRIERRVAEPEEFARDARVHWATLTRAYEAMRAAALAEEGYDESLRGGQTEAELLTALGAEMIRLEFPPIGWGMGTAMGKRPRGWTYEERCERWSARTRQERLSDPRHRDVRHCTCSAPHMPDPGCRIHGVPAAALDVRHRGGA